MATKNITAIPAGVTRLDLFESANPLGPWSEVSQITVAEGDTSFTYNFQSNYYYKFRLYYPGSNTWSAFSSVWGNVTDDRLCVVSGTCYDAAGNPLAGVTVTATLLVQTMATDDNDQVAGSVSVVTGVGGIWSLSLFKTSVFSDPTARYQIEFSGLGFSERKVVTIPDLALCDYEDLPLAGSLSGDYDLSFSLDPDSVNWFIGEVKYLSFIVGEGESRLSALPGISAEVRVRVVETDEDGVEEVTYLTDSPPGGDGWASASIEEMTIRLLMDSSAWEASFSSSLGSRKYLADVALIRTVSQGPPAIVERIVSKAFKIKVKG